MEIDQAEERFAAMMLRPFDHFDDPRSVSQAPDLSLTEKVSILKMMERELAEAPASAHDRAADLVREALHDLRAADGSS